MRCRRGEALGDEAELKFEKKRFFSARKHFSAIAFYNHTRAGWIGPIGASGVSFSGMLTLKENAIDFCRARRFATLCKF